MAAFNTLVAFGDSYTDVGNLPSSPPDYYNGRFSNGPLWIEYLAQSQGIAFNAATDFAVSGSEAEDLGTQIGNYAGTSDSTNTLFAIWSGNNDFAGHLDLGMNDSAWNQQIEYVVSSLMDAADLLYQKGARNVILFNQMDLTETPEIRNQYSASFQSYLRGKITTSNSRISDALPQLLNSHPGLQVYYVDVYSDFNYLLTNYNYYGFTQTTVGALNDPNLSDRSFGGPGANYVFWDSQHPTTKTHSYIASWVNSALPVDNSPPKLSIALSNGIVELQLSGVAGAAYVFEGTSNFSDWVPISTNVNESGTINISDAKSANFSQRFYRARLVR